MICLLVQVGIEGLYVCPRSSESSSTRPHPFFLILGTRRGADKTDPTEAEHEREMKTTPNWCQTLITGRFCHKASSDFEWGIRPIMGMSKKWF
ncbi:hypothetical protein JTE90_019700 [Oedothorax gibbosus]|uniref:Uncharacterized protein n=1 Tax=Oedothorax gibbosus TaxID=931172 RepID=A0AAV6U3M9_9ARAC|nr:hypothetical protein JTE90_019700 [Oedothorax gibbosus]